MANYQQQQARLLEQYCDALAENPQALPPAELDAAFVSLAQRLYQQAGAAEPSSTFAWRLEQRLATAPTAIADSRTNPAARSIPAASRRFPLQSWLMPHLATAAMLALLVVGAALLAGILSGRNPAVGSGNTSLASPTPQLPSIDTIRGNASKALEGNLIGSLILTETATVSGTANSSDVKVGGQRTIRYQSPNLWRIEVSGSMLPSIDAADKTTDVSDGTFLGKYDANQNVANIYPVDTLYNPKGSPNPLQQVLGNDDSLGWLTSKCYHPSIAGSDIIAGRPAYRIELGHYTCEGDVATGNIYTIWVDQENYLILKSLTYVVVNGGIYITTEATNVQYNVPIDPATFTFTPPASAKVYDYRTSEPNKQALQQKLTQQLLAAAAKTLGLTTDEVQNELAKGATFAQLAKSSGVSEADLKAAVINVVKPALEQLVQTGQLTQQDEDNFIQTVQDTDLSKPTNMDTFGIHEQVATPAASGTNTP